MAIEQDNSTCTLLLFEAHRHHDDFQRSSELYCGCTDLSISTGMAGPGHAT